MVNFCQKLTGSRIRKGRQRSLITGLSLQKLNRMVRASQTRGRSYEQQNDKSTETEEPASAILLSCNYGDGWKILPEVQTGMFTMAAGYSAERRGDCFGFGCAVAYLADAVGYTSYAVSSGGHGWAEVNGRVYDANWAKGDRQDRRVLWYETTISAAEAVARTTNQTEHM